jgi:hypothetical protein
MRNKKLTSLGNDGKKASKNKFPTVSFVSAQSTRKYALSGAVKPSARHRKRAASAQAEGYICGR